MYNNFFPENVVDELENNLGRVTTITGSLKISRSFPIVSLDFFKKLVEIQGVRPAESEAKWDELKDSHYSLEILENENLQKLFPDGSNVTITQRLVLTYIYTPTHKNQEVNADKKVPSVKIFKLYQYENPACNSILFLLRFALLYFFHKECQGAQKMQIKHKSLISEE